MLQYALLDTIIMINRKENLHMKKRLPVILVIVAIIAIALIYIFTRHTHTFSEATCTTAKICECGEIAGEPLGHTWVDATCTTAKTCSVCNLTEGTPLEHQWIEATTENPKTCELCSLTEGEPLPAKQATVEGYEVTEETTTEDSSEIGSDVELTEDDYKEPLPEETTNEEMSELEKEAEALGTIPEALAEAKKLMEQWAAEDAQKNNTQVDVDYPGMTPASEATEQESNLGKGGELPDHLKGNPFD